MRPQCTPASQKPRTSVRGGRHGPPSVDFSPPSPLRRRNRTCGCPYSAMPAGQNTRLVTHGRPPRNEIRGFLLLGPPPCPLLWTAVAGVTHIQPGKHAGSLYTPIAPTATSVPPGACPWRHPICIICAPLRNLRFYPNSCINLLIFHPTTWFYRTNVLLIPMGGPPMPSSPALSATSSHTQNDTNEPNAYADGHDPQCNATP